MRRGNNPKEISIDDVFVGFDLSSDYCAEHEFGIKELNRILNRNEETHRINPEKIDDYMVFSTTKDNEFAILHIGWDVYFNKKHYPERILKEKSKKKEILKYHHAITLYDPPNRELKDSEKDFYSIASAWCQEDFAILVRGKDLVEKLKMVYEAFKKNDIAIWLGGGHVFKNAGFCVAIYSKLPESVIKGWESYYLDKKMLEKASLETGIEEKLNKSDKEYYALCADWISPEQKKKEPNRTKYPVIYYLNPCEQQKYNYGWFSVEELEQWIENSGPIIKTEKNKE